MTSSTARSAGLGAVVTFAGFAASLGGAAVAHADPTGAAFGTDQEATSCSIDAADIQFAPAAEDGKTPVGGWQSAVGFHRTKNEPTHGFLVKIKDGAKIADGCTRTISLASYTAQGKTWEDSQTQGFVGVVNATLGAGNTSATLVVPLPTGTDAKNCYGQLDLYFGNIVYDGKTDDGHGPVPSFPTVTNPPPADLISAWNGLDNTPCAAPTSTSSSSPKPALVPSTPSSSSAIKPSTTASTPPSTPTATTSSPSGPALAHTGSNAGVISLVALTLFGAGGATVLGSRKAAAARRH
ncbi:MAG: hypothetical protein ACJ786_14970 [Catenulispora sp.]